MSSVRTEVSHIWTVFCDILQKQRNSIFIKFMSGRLDRASERSSLKSFPHSNWIMDLSELLDIIWTYFRVVRTACRDWTSFGRVATSSGRLAKTPQTVSIAEIQLRVEIGEAWPRVRTVLLWHLDIFNAETSRHCRVSGRKVLVVRKDVANWRASGRDHTSSVRLLGIRLLWVGIYTEASLNIEIAFMKLVTLATCHNIALSTSEK